MQMLVFHMEICEKQQNRYLHCITHKKDTGKFWYDPATRNLFFIDGGPVVEILKRNPGQLLKILHTRRWETFHTGFELTFCICDGKNLNQFNDMRRIVTIDRRGDEDVLTIIDAGKDLIHEVYTDGCFLKDTSQSGFAVILKYPDDNYAVHALGSDADNNCQAELQAVVKGFELWHDIPEIRLLTDSRYVRKGITEWMFNWKLNNWQTANCEQARHAKEWKKLEKLTRNKYVEVAWIKSHSGHFENTMCDLYARDAAENSG